MIHNNKSNVNVLKEEGSSSVYHRNPHTDSSRHTRKDAKEQDMGTRSLILASGKIKVASDIDEEEFDGSEDLIGCSQEEEEDDESVESDQSD